MLKSILLFLFGFWFQLVLKGFWVLFLAAEMVNIQHKLLATEEVMKQIWQQLSIVTEGMMEVQVLMAEFTREAQERDHLMKTLLTSFENELANARADVEYVKLTRRQTETIVREIKTLEEISNLGVRSCQDVDVAELITPSLFKVPLRRKFCIPFSLQLLKVEVINTYHAKFYIEIPTGRPVILIVKFSFVLPPLLDSKNGREPHSELDLVAPRGI